MTEIHMKLRSSLLPAPMIIKNYVAGDENCNYEKYLLEIVNASEVFKLLSGGKEYTAPDNEAHGENDANSDEYSLDFKLVESSTYLEAYNSYKIYFQNGTHECNWRELTGYIYCLLNLGKSEETEA